MKYIYPYFELTLFIAFRKAFGVEAVSNKL